MAGRRRNTKRYRDNPEAQEGIDFLRTHYQAIKQHVKNPDLLPDYINPTVLGCGVNGCVFKTQVPNVVMKITSAENEAAFTKFAIYNPRKGLVPFFDIMPLNVPFEFNDVTHVIWRFEAIDPGSMMTADRNMFNATREALGQAQDLAFMTALATVSPARVSQAREQYEEFLERYAAYSYIHDALLYYLDRNWLLTDFHNLNIGLDDEGDWIIFDFLAFEI